MTRLRYRQMKSIELGEKGIALRRFQGQVAAGAGLPDAVADHLFGRRIEQVGRQQVVATGILVADIAFEAAAHIFDQLHHVLFLLPPLHHGLEDRTHVADRYALAHQPLKDLGDSLQWQDPLNLLDQLTIALLHLLQQVAGFLDADEIPSVFAQHMGQVPGEHLVDRQEGTAGTRQAITLALLHPKARTSRQERFAFYVGHADKLQLAELLLNQKTPRLQPASRHRHFLQQDAVLPRAERAIETQADTRERHAMVQIERLADPCQFIVQRSGFQGGLQLAVHIDEQGHRQGKDLRIAARLRLASGFQRGSAGTIGQQRRQTAAVLLACLFDPPLANRPPASAADHQREHEERYCREARDECEQPQQGATDQQRLGLRHDLAADVRPQVMGTLTVAGDDDSRGDGDQQRRHLADHAVADGEHRVDLQRISRAHALLHHADGQASQQVDDNDHQPGDSITLDELHRAIHGTEHLAGLLHLATALTGLVDVDDPGAQVAVDAHLLARHGVEGKPRADFRYPLGALGDDQELHDGDDQEQDAAHHQVATHHKVAESLHDLPGIGFQQDHPRGTDRQRQAKQRGDQQHRGEHREMQWRDHIHRHHQQHHRDGDVQGDQQVQQQGRQWQDHHEHYRQQHHGQHQVLALADPAEYPGQLIHRRASRRRHSHKDGRSSPASRSARHCRSALAQSPNSSAATTAARHPTRCWGTARNSTSSNTRASSGRAHCRCNQANSCKTSCCSFDNFMCSHLEQEVNAVTQRAPIGQQRLHKRRCLSVPGNLRRKQLLHQRTQRTGEALRVVQAAQVMLGPGVGQPQACRLILRVQLTQVRLHRVPRPRQSLASWRGTRRVGWRPR
ncbi:hypothetical protein WR25_16517 [Diploscapter pachys]|uniref:Uncharacterized protein n=1 Tax=Diploscapter pachys TaxID=2018661 RepID=A0A2A2KJ11_9BILA|nr:hypothetical protein WR25_16517 [Diploscapter pachys]